MDSILSGRHSRNYPAINLETDHLFYQAKQARLQIAATGRFFPLYSLVGRKEFFTSESAYAHLSNICPAFAKWDELYDRTPRSWVH